MNPVDRIFSEKLERHQTVPSADAWANVEAGLARKAAPVAWMRWAAVLVPGLVAAALWLHRPAEAPVLTGKVTPESITPSAPVYEPVLPVVNKPAVASNTATRKKKSTVSVPVPVAESPAEVVSLLPETATLEEITIEPTAPIEEVAAVTEEQQPIVLVYTLEPVVANTDDRKPTSLERVVEIARTIKHSDPIGDLRGFKDELLALDLRKKSTKKN